MQLMFLLLAVIVSVTGCSSLGNDGRPELENTEPIESLGAKIGKDVKGRVVEIDLSNRPVGNEELKVIAQYKHLQKLWLANTGVTDAGLPSLSPLRKLRVLGLASTGVTDAGLPSLIPLQNLKDLRLARTSVTDAGLPYLLELRLLQKVHLYPNNITDSAVEELNAKRKAAKLPRIIVEY